MLPMMVLLPRSGRAVATLRKSKDFAILVVDRISLPGNGDTATGTVCGVHFSVCHGGTNDVEMNFSSKNHQTTMSSSSTSVRHSLTLVLAVVKLPRILEGNERRST